MFLIPSESYGFPDHFTRTVTPSPKPKNEELEAAPLETRQKNLRLLRCPVQSRSRHRQLARKIPKQCAANRLCLCRIQPCVGRAPPRPLFPRPQSVTFPFIPL